MFKWFKEWFKAPTWNTLCFLCSKTNPYCYYNGSADIPKSMDSLICGTCWQQNEDIKNREINRLNKESRIEEIAEGVERGLTNYFGSAGELAEVTKGSFSTEPVVISIDKLSEILEAFTRNVSKPKRKK